MKKIDVRMTIGDSVTECPALTGVYMTYGVDFCCGGDRSVEEALKDSKTDQSIIAFGLDSCTRLSRSKKMRFFGELHR